MFFILFNGWTVNRFLCSNLIHTYYKDDVIVLSLQPMTVPWNPRPLAGGHYSYLLVNIFVHLTEHLDSRYWFALQNYCCYHTCRLYTVWRQ